MCSTIFGPASSPLFVTCATTNTGMPRPFATFISKLPQARTWDTLPGADSKSPQYMVWMESMIRNAGFSSSTASSTFPMSVSASRYRFERSPRQTRSARILICSSDSSPET